MKFTKMQGIGNDYVYVNCFQEKIAAPSDLAVRISDRHFGVGSDGLILICPSEIADFRWSCTTPMGAGRRCAATVSAAWANTSMTRA